MDFKEQPIQCQTVLCTKPVEFYVYGKKKYLCGNCQKLEHRNKKVIRVPTLKDVQDHLEYLRMKIARMIDYLNTYSYVENKEDEETSMLEDLVHRMERKQDKLKAAIEKADEPYIYGEIDQKIANVMEKLQKDGIYIEFLIAQENKTVNILTLKGQQQTDFETDLAYERQIKRFQDQIDLIRQEYDKKHEESLKAKKAKFRKKNEDLKQEKLALEKEIKSVTKEKDKKITKLKKKLESAKTEKQDYDRQLREKDEVIELKENENFILNSKLEECKGTFRSQVQSLAKENSAIQSSLETSKANENYQKDLLNKKITNDEKKFAFLKNLIPIFNEIQKQTGDFFHAIVDILPYLDFSKTLKHEQLSLLVNLMTGRKFKADVDIDLRVFLNNKYDLHLLKVLSNFTLPPIREFSLDCLPKNAEKVTDVLLNIKLLSWERLHFNCDSFEVFDVISYVNVIKKMGENINTKEIYIYNWKINNKQLVELMSVLKHVNAIGIIRWKLKIDQEFSFGDSLDGAKFDSLEFWNTGKKEFSDFKSHPERIRNILKALGEVEDVRKNLKYLDFSKEDIETNEVEKMLKDYNLANWELRFPE